MICQNFLKLACNVKTDLHRAKRIDTSNSRSVLKHTWGSLGLVFNVILGSFGVFITKWHVTRKRLVIEENGVQFQQEMLVEDVQGHFGVIWCSYLKTAYSLKTADRFRSETDWNLGIGGSNGIHVGHILGTFNWVVIKIILEVICCLRMAYKMFASYAVVHVWAWPNFQWIIGKLTMNNYSKRFFLKWLNQHIRLIDLHDLFSYHRA